MGRYQVVIQPVTNKVEFNLDVIPKVYFYLSVNLIPNGGGPDTTDWVDTNSDGLADYWDVVSLP